MEWRVSLFALSAIGACGGPSFGPPDRPPGIQLVHGRNLGDPTFGPSFEAPDVLYARHPTGLPGVTGPDPFGPRDLLAVPHGGGAERLLVPGMSPNFAQAWDAQNHLYAVRSEHELPSPPGGSGDPVPAGTLVRLDYATGTAAEILEVTGYQVSYAYGLLAYRTQGQGPMPDVRIRTADGREHDVGPATGERFVRGRLYYVGGDEHALARVWPPDEARPSPEPETLLADVERFFLRPDEQMAIVTTGPASSRAVFALDVRTRTTRKLPGEGLCCLLGYSPDGKQYVYAEARPSSGRGRLHVYTFGDGGPPRDEAFDAPDGTGEFHRIWWRPGSGMALLGDEFGTMSVFDRAASPPIRLLGRTAYVPAFVRDGRLLVFVDHAPDDPDGKNRLVVMDADDLGPRAPARELTPPGTSTAGYFTLDGMQNVAFWAHFGPDAVDDLYFADLDAGAARVVARRVGPMAVESSTLVGIVRRDIQDLTGDLVRIDVASGVERLVAHNVDDFALARACPTCDPFAPGALLGYVVRGRFASGIDGLWGTVLE